jgi:hypothetical protein
MSKKKISHAKRFKKFFFCKRTMFKFRRCHSASDVSFSVGTYEMEERHPPRSVRNCLLRNTRAHAHVCDVYFGGRALTDQDHACVRDNPGLDCSRFRGRAHAWDARVDRIPPQLAGAVQRARYLGHDLVIGENEDGLVVIVL